MRVDPREPFEDAEDACCRVCGRQAPLTFEHLPPQAAGNRDRAEMIGLEAWLGEEQGQGPARGRYVQRGSGAYTLCKQCNERAGQLYVPELLTWIRSAEGGLGRSDPPVDEFDGMLGPAYTTATLKDVRPARFLKQVVTMLLALSPGGFPPRNLDLMAFAQDPGWVGLPPEYQFYLALYCGPIARFNGGGVMLRQREDGRWGNTYTMEFSYPPFSYVLSVDEDGPAIEAGNITAFADLGIDQTADVEIQMRLGFGHTILPLDYRTKAMLERDKQANIEAETEVH